MSFLALIEEKLRETEFELLAFVLDYEADRRAMFWGDGPGEFTGLKTLIDSPPGEFTVWNR